jgi:cobalt-precorrin 5A hydrolase
MIAIGIGANSRARGDDFVTVIADVRRETGGDIVATVDKAPFENFVKSAASRQAVAYRPLALEALRQRNDDCVTRSERTLDLFGIASVAEAAALAAAGPGSHLVVPRRIVGNITVAAAKSADAKERPE